jgi:hypothetical protein
MTAVELRRLTRKDLAQHAKRGRIDGWHGMKKDELVKALLNQQRKERRRWNGATAKNRPANGTNGSHSGNGDHPSTNGRMPVAASRTNGHSANGVARNRDLSSGFPSSNGQTTDRVEVDSDDAYWIHVKWSFTNAAVARAEAALGIDWHRAVPVIRLFDVTAGDEEGTDCRIQVGDIVIHGNVDHWHVPVDHPDKTYSIHIGYGTPSGRFHALAHSPAIKTPKPGAKGAVDRSWKRDTKRAKPQQRNGHGANGGPRPNLARRNGDSIDDTGSIDRDFPFQVDAELIVHGSTHPQASLTLLGEPVQLTKDGRFSLRFALPNGRQVIPAVTVTPSGGEQHTIVLAIERVTRELAPQPTDELY